MIERIEHRGRLIAGCPLPDETRADDVVPTHANAIQVSRDRFLLVYTTHTYRGSDDEKEPAGVYYAAIHYTEPHAGSWRFAAVSR